MIARRRGASVAELLVQAPPFPPDVSFGSLADILRRQCDVRFTPKSGHVQCKGGCPLSAKSGHSAIHSMTSSARDSIVAGTVSPSTLAVLRFMTSSNLVGC